MSIAFFPGCMVDMIYPEAGIAAVNVLERLGCDLALPRNQVCCGQALINSGYRKDTAAAARLIVDAYDRLEYESIVSLTGSCMNAIINDYEIVFRDDPVYLERTRALAGRFHEFTDYIVNVLGAHDVGASYHDTVTLHRSCHVTRLLGIKEPPLTLLENVEGLEYVEMAHADRCCGFGGTFSVKQPEISGAMSYEKAQTVIDTGANVLVGTDIACLLNVKGALGRMRKTGRLAREIKVLHLAQILDSKE